MSPSALPFVAVAAALSVAAVVWQIAVRPMFGRLAIRGALRRPGETGLVILGSLLGTAIITGSFIVGDTLKASVRATAHTQLGPVDELVAVRDPATARRVADRIRALEDPRVDGVMPLTVAPAPIAARVDGRRRAEPRAQLVALPFKEARRFGGDQEATGISGGAPAAGEIVLVEDLASALGVDAGSRVTAYLYGRRLHLQVDRVVEQKGLAGFWTGRTSVSPNALVDGSLPAAARGTLPAGAAPPRTYVAVSNRGGVEEGATLTGEVVDLVRTALPDRLPARVQTVKQDRLKAADEEGQAFMELFLGIGTFAIVAGVLLLVNIFVMLAEERKSQLGMMRAIGLRRSDLIRIFTIEGVFYSVASGALGALAGIGVGYAIVRIAAPIFASAGRLRLELLFDMTAASLAGGLCIGVLISMATVAFTSVRISRLNIIRAIRELPEPRMSRTRLRALLAGSLAVGLGGAWSYASVTSPGSYAGAILGMPFVLFGAVPLVARWVPRRYAVIAAATGSMVWGIFGDALTGGRFYEGGEIFAFVLQGILLTFSAVVFLSQMQETMEGVIHKVAARSLPLRLGLAYPLARRLRTGLTLGMYSLVIFTMVFIAVMTTVFGGQLDATTRSASGGFDIVATAASSNPPSADDLRRVRGVDEVARIRYGQALFRPASSTEPAPWTISGIDDAFVAAGPPALSERSPLFESDRAAWAAVVDDPSNVIVPEVFLQDEGGPPQQLVSPGDRLEVVDPLTGRNRVHRVIALVDTDLVLGGAYVSVDSVRSLFGSSVPASRFFVSTDAAGPSASEVADRLRAAFVENGLDAQTFRQVVEDFGQLNLEFLRLMQGYLALGLLVGVAGLGVVMVRAVRERRREIGVLRALGFQPRQVRQAFTLESAFVAVEGIVIGAALGLVTASQLIANGDFGEGIRFVVPWTDVAVLTTTALLASLVATAWPARRASTIAPAVALRIAD